MRNTIENSINDKMLFRNKNKDSLTEEDRLLARDTIASDFLAIVGEKEYETLLPMIKLLLSFLDGDAPDEIALSTCRRLSKSTKTVILMIISIIRLPWYNAVMSVKFANRIGLSIVPSMRNSIEIMRNSGWITPEESLYLIDKCLTHTGLTVNGRKIIFTSAQSPDAALSIQATTSANGYIGIYIHQVDDELIIEEFKGAQSIKISDEEQLRALNSIKESVNRNLTPPFGKSYQRIRLFNAWDFSHKYYVDVIEKHIPTSDRYKNIKRKEEAEANRSYLIDEDNKTDGILFTEYVKNELLYKVMVISYKALPIHRFSIKDYNNTKETDYNRWLPIYGAVPGKPINQKHTYQVNFEKVKTLEDLKGQKITNIMIGLDRGKRDKTSVAVILKTSKNKWILYSAFESTEYDYDQKKSKKDITDYLVEIIKPFRGIMINTIGVNCDFHAYDFISILNEYTDLRLDVFTIFANVQKKLFIFEPVKLRGFFNSIKNRVDVFNDKLIYDGIIIMENKHTTSSFEISGVEMLERFESCIDNETTGDRDEKYGKNDLDAINAMEYAVVNDID